MNRTRADKLRAIIERDTTPEGERRAAEEALRRLSASPPAAPEERQPSPEPLRLGSFPVLLDHRVPQGQALLMVGNWLVVNPEDWPSLRDAFETTGSTDKAIAALAAAGAA